MVWMSPGAAGVGRGSQDSARKRSTSRTRPAPLITSWRRRAHCTHSWWSPASPTAGPDGAPVAEQPTFDGATTVHSAVKARRASRSHFRQVSEDGESSVDFGQGRDTKQRVSRVAQSITWSLARYGVSIMRSASVAHSRAMAAGVVGPSLLNHCGSDVHIVAITRPTSSGIRVRACPCSIAWKS